MSSVVLTGSKRLTALLAMLAALACLCGCLRSPQQRVVYVQWHALLAYHPLWDAQVPSLTLSPPTQAYAGGKTSWVLPALGLQPAPTAEAEVRRQRIRQTEQQQQQALVARLQQMEERLLKQELAHLEAEQEAEAELARLTILHQAEQETEQVLKDYQPHQAETEVKLRILQRLQKIRPDLQTQLVGRIQSVEGQREKLSAELQHTLSQIEASATTRIREQTEAVQHRYRSKREELHAQSRQRLQRQVEQARASIRVSAFSESAQPTRFPSKMLSAPVPLTPETQSTPPNAVTAQEIRRLAEQEVKLWIESICRKHRWQPIWQPREGIPDVTVQIAQEMKGKLP